ncbi:cysteine desulfurase [archaeon]|nr:cysteine desulfurase [archaeon]
MKMEVYLDNSATTQVDGKIIKLMNKYFSENYGNPSSLHDFGRRAKESLDKSREIIAKKINTNKDEIIFTSGGSESNNLALNILKEGDHLITTKIEHPSIFETAKNLERKGIKVTYLNVNKEGFVDLDELKKSINKNTKLVSIIHGNNEIGVIQDLEAIGKICKNILFHTDAVQSFCKINIDVNKFNLSLASFSSHKIHGPKGVGALYVKKGLELNKMILGGHQEMNKRGGTENVPGIVGFGEAIKLIKENDIKRIGELRDFLIKELLKIPRTRLNGSKNKRLCNNINISFELIEGEGLMLHLDMKGVKVSTGSACSSQTLEPSHVLIAIGLPHEIAHGSIRFSLSKNTTKKELLYTIKKVKEVAKLLRKISPLKDDTK